MENKHTINWQIPTGFRKEILTDAESQIFKVMNHRSFEKSFTFQGLPSQFYFFNNKDIDCMESWELQDIANKTLKRHIELSA